METLQQEEERESISSDPATPSTGSTKSASSEHVQQEEKAHGDEATSQSPAQPMYEKPACWVCHGDSRDRPLLSNVCACKGSLGYVHQKCIDNWVFKQKKEVCASCNEQYMVLTSYRKDSPPMPSHTFSRLMFCFCHFYIPFMWKIMVGILAGFARFLLAPVLLGSFFYHTPTLIQLLTPILSEYGWIQQQTASTSSSGMDNGRNDEGDPTEKFSSMMAQVLDFVDPPSTGIGSSIAGSDPSVANPSAVDLNANDTTAGSDSSGSLEPWTPGVLECFVLGIIPIIALRAVMLNYRQWKAFFARKTDTESASSESGKKISVQEAEALYEKSAEELPDGEGEERGSANASADNNAVDDSALAAEKISPSKKRETETEKEVESPSGPGVLPELFEALAAARPNSGEEEVNLTSEDWRVLSKYLTPVDAAAASSSDEDEDSDDREDDTAEDPGEGEGEGGEGNRTRKGRKADAFTVVENLMSAADSIESLGDVPQSSADWQRFAIEVVGSAFLVFNAKFLPWQLVLASSLAITVIWRLWFRTPKPLQTSEAHLRMEIAKQRRALTTPFDMKRMFMIYSFDIAIFSGILPVLMGLVLHYSYTGIAADTHARDFTASGLSFACHWIMGALILILLVRVEGGLMMALFAPGIDFFILRSIDITNAADTWGWVHAQVFDVDPLKVVLDFVRISLAELVHIVIVARTPFFLFELLMEMSFPQLPWVAGESLLAQILYTIPAVLLFGTWVIFLAEYPIRRPILKFLRPLVRNLAKLFFLERYLIDEEKWAMVGEWLALPVVPAEEGGDDLTLVDPPVDRMLVRRERWLALEGYRPRFLRLRVLGFSLLFFSISALVPTAMFVTSIMLLCDVLPTLPLLLTVSLCVPLLCVSPWDVGLSLLRLLVTLFYFLFAYGIFPMAENLYNLVAIPLVEATEQTYDMQYLQKRHVASRRIKKFIERYQDHFAPGRAQQQHQAAAPATGEVPPEAEEDF